ncbi:hypothetical protein M409DRAFT_15884 [Zasmidium cellare ATCC 36951]|uniref:Uncharacterized protein n=1 Tax=Zasmidium cellare ATCC 36951 TaxID=1080233 RepID=A0A6A6D7J0_ZASCE|nr:uncharacterized protein M409DRAFT_15884 [Zasmidium cellare ATCC 36951]KAF2173606.1 hypothetical protein M409DRAFT_15884 [Zasmidium cellare ATCC 36951]
MPRQLTITPTPFKSSYLSIPPTPFSPRLPITPPVSPPKTFPKNTPTAHLKATADLLPPPTEPLPWLWQCHRCKRVYQLGVTRRCLDDGHLFCAGSTVVKRSKKNSYKKVVRHQACASEFDYQGWKAWGVWRGEVKEQVRAAEALIRVEEGVWFKGLFGKNGKGKGGKDCWNECHYPSECTWSKRFGGGIPTAGANPTVPSTTTTGKKEEQRKTAKQEEENTTKTAISFDDILLSIADPTSSDYLAPLTTTSTTTPTTTTTDPLEPDASAPSMDDLLQSVKRRKRRSSGQIPLVPSPLGANPFEEEGKDELHVLRKSASSGALLEGLERDVEDEGKRGAGGEWREKADALVRSF